MEVENKDFWKLSGIVLGLVAVIILLMMTGCKTKYIASEPVLAMTLEKRITDMTTGLAA